MAQSRVTLKRTLSLPAMVFYGLGTIVGAGIYVLIGKIAGEAGAWTPFAFLLAAVIAGFTGFSYAELVARHPRSAGEAVYVRQAFRKPWLSQLVGWSVVLTGLVSAATLLKGFSGYFHYLVGGNPALIIVVTIVLLTVLACLGVRESVGVAVVITILELVGLLLVVAASSSSIIDGAHWQQWWQQLQSPPWQGIAAATFLAFYAFIGFEDMVNMAEEVKRVRIVLPAAIMITLVIATLVYIMVAMVAVIDFSPAELAASSAPLATMTEGSPWLSARLLALISLIAIINGVIVQLLMAPRVIYGITASSPWLQQLSRVHHKTRTPVNATLAASVLIAVFALLMPLARLAQLTSAIILCLFILVNASLLVMKKRDVFDGFQVPLWVPALGILASALLLVAQLLIGNG